MDNNLERQMRRYSEKASELGLKLGEVSAKHAQITYLLRKFLARFNTEILPMHERLLDVQRQITDIKILTGEKERLDETTGSTSLLTLLNPPSDSVEAPIREAMEQSD